MQPIKKGLFAFVLIISSFIALSGCYDALIDIMPPEQFIKLKGVVHFGALTALDLEVVDLGENQQPATIKVYDASGTPVTIKNITFTEVGVFNIPLSNLKANTNYRVEVEYSSTIGDLIKTPQVQLQTKPFSDIILNNKKISSTSTNHLFESTPDIGSLAVTRFGHVWSTTDIAPNPNNTFNKTSFTSLSGNKFNSNINIPISETYYVWAYATDEVNFTFSPYTIVEPVSNNVFTSTTNEVSNLTISSATINGAYNISVGTITNYGIAISSTNPYPTTTANEQKLETFSIVGGSNVYSKNFTGLAANTMYYARAFASDGIITKYGLPVSFTTGAPTETITITNPKAGNSYIKGSVLSINWNANFALPVSIELYKGSVLERVIVSTITNTGTYGWSIPFDVISGNVYRVKIYKANDAAISTYSYDFTIQ